MSGNMFGVTDWPGIYSYGVHETEGAQSAHGIPEEAESTIRPMDKKTIEELVAMMPCPWIFPAVFAALIPQMPFLLGLGALGSRSGPLNDSEKAIVLAALLDWTKNSGSAAQITDQNSLRQALQLFINQSGGTVSGNTMDMVSLLRNSPVLLNSLAMVDADIIARAYTKSEQQIIIAQLDRWIQTIAEQRRLAEEDETHRFRTGNDSATRTLEDYLRGVRNGVQALSQPMLSCVVTGVSGANSVEMAIKIDPTTGHAFIDPAQTSVLPMGQDVTFNAVVDMGGGLSAQVQGNVNSVAMDTAQFIQNVQITAAYWAIPSAYTLMTAGALHTQDHFSEAAVRSYAMTLAQFTLSPEFTKFITDNFISRLPPEARTPEKIDELMAKLKTILLTNALAALDKIETGGVVIRAADIRDLLTGKVALNDSDFRSTLVKLINEQLGHLQDGPRQELLASLFTYIDSNPNVSALADPTQSILATLDPNYALNTPTIHAG